MSQPLIAITKRQALLFAAFLVAYEFLTYIANDMIMPGMPQVIHQFHAHETAIASSLTYYILGGASLQLLLGPISDHYGRRPVMLAGALLFLIFTFLIACSQSIQAFLLFRFCQGMGLCFISVIGYTTLQEIFEEMAAVRLIAIMANIATTAPLIGPLLGAYFIIHWSWQLIFYLIGLGAFIALWGLWKYMPESVGITKHDGTIIHRTTLSCNSILNNYTQLFCHPRFLLGSISLGLLCLPCILWIALSPVILIHAAHLSVIEYALWQLPLFSAVIIGNWLLHKLTHYYTLTKLISMGSIVTLLSLLMVYFIPYYFNPYFTYLLPGLILYFFTLGLISGPLNRFILFSTPIAKGTTSALMSIVCMCIEAIG